MELIKDAAYNGIYRIIRSWANFAKDLLRCVNGVCYINLAGTWTKAEFKECFVASQSTSHNLFSLKIALSRTSRNSHT